MKTIVDRIKASNAGAPCIAAMQWLGTRKDGTAAWQECHRGDWMLWLIGWNCSKNGSAAHRKLVLATCAVARLALKYVREGDERPLKIIQTTEDWAKKKRGVTKQHVKDIMYNSGTGNAAEAAREAANSAGWWPEDAYVVAEDVAAAAKVGASIVGGRDTPGDAYTKMLARCADVVRKFYPKPPRLT